MCPVSRIEDALAVHRIVTVTRFNELTSAILYIRVTWRLFAISWQLRDLSMVLLPVTFGRGLKGRAEERIEMSEIADAAVSGDVGD